jgi:hypothetical protein
MVATHPVIILEMADHRLDGGAAAHDLCNIQPALRAWPGVR